MPAFSSIALALTAAATAGSTIAGAAGAASQREQALASNSKAVQEWLNVHVPDPEQQKIVLKKYVQTGQLDPKLEEAVRQEASNYEKIQSDPRLKESQLNALSALENISENGGHTLDQDAYLQKVTNDVNTADRGRRLAIQNKMAERGMGGSSGLDLVAQLDSSQDATQRQSDASLVAARDAKLNALSAIEKGGALAGNMRDQDYKQQSDVARAKDEINNFNSRMLSSTKQRNVDRTNDAQKFNVNREQEIANANVDLGNKEETYNKELVQKKFDNDAKVASGKANAHTGQANTYNAAADRTANMWSGITSGVGKIGGAVYDKAYDAEHEDDEDEE